MSKRTSRPAVAGATLVPVGAHDGHENDGLLTEHATPASHGLLPVSYCLEPSIYGGVETQLASNGATTFAAVNDLALPATPTKFSGTVTNDVVLTTTFNGKLYALDAANGTVLFKTPMSAGSNAPVAVDGDYVIAGAGAALSAAQHDLIIAYKLGATGKLPDAVGS